MSISQRRSLSSEVWMVQISGLGFPRKKKKKKKFLANYISMAKMVKLPEYGLIIS